MKNILILSANPINTDKLRLDEEVREIQAALERSQSREDFELITRGAVRIDDLRRALLDNQPQIVHFSGHGVRTNNLALEKNQGTNYQREAVRLHSQTGGIALENEFGQMQLVSTKSLADLFGLFKEKVECVLLNACYSETQSNAISQHIDCVIGMERAITDDAAIHFSTAFYDALGAGRNYADAFEFGCNNIDLNNISESLTPKIKIRNNSKTLFPLKPKEQKPDMTGNRNIHIGSGNYNERIEGNYVQGNYYAGGEKQSLAEAATEIQKLLEQLDKSYSSNTTLGKMQIAAETIKSIENNPTLAERVTSALKAGGVQAIGQLLNHPAASFVIGALEDWEKTKGS